MNVTEHLPHSSNTETRLQWIAIGCMALGLITSIYFHAHALKADRIESELTSYLHLNDRYHHLLFTLLQNDSEIFKKTDNASLQKNKYILYELFELFATIQLLEGYFHELDADVWPCWDRRMKFLLSKPAVQHAWQSRRIYADQIYKPQFTHYVESIIAQHAVEEEQRRN